MKFPWRKEKETNKSEEMSAVSTGPPGPGPDEVSFISRFSYSWLNSLIRLGAHRQLHPTDLWPVPKHEEVEFQESLFEKEYHRQAEALEAKRKEGEPVAFPSIHSVLTKVHTRDYLKAMVLMFISSAFNLAAPTIIREIITYINTPSTATWVGYVLVVSSQETLAYSQQRKWGVTLARSHTNLLLACRLFWL